MIEPYLRHSLDHPPGDARVTSAKLAAPPDEVRRLEVLAQYGILDTTAEQEFDDLARLATYIAGTPMAMVSLIDADRQWFKSKIGLDIDQTPRNVSFCDHAIRGRELFVVPDAQADKRFAENPLVTGEPHIRFYAGMPLVSPEGTALGTLCVVDRVPRELSREQQEALRVLGRQVNAQLDLRRNMLKLVRTYAELAGAQEKLAAVLHAATTVAIIATNTDGLLTLFNPGAERLLGWTAEEVIGKKSALDFILKNEIEERAAELGRRLGKRIRGLGYFAELARQGIHEERPWTHVRKDGSYVPAKLAVAALHDANSEISGFMGVSKDLTERRRYEQELIRAREAAEDASRTKSEFLANISHEIRTPLNAILGLTELAMGTALSPEQREYLAGIQESGRGLLALMNDVLDFSRIENRKLELYTINFPLRETLADILRTFGLRAYQKGLELILQVAPDVPDVVCADAMRLRQILTNLVGNSIKFTERGEIVLRVFVDIGREDHTLLQFSVADTGIGVLPAKLAIIFDPFTQADSSTHRKYGGTGLGLAISKELVEWMGGQMWVESAPGRGSTFHFSLPVRGRQGPPAAPQGNLSGLTVLVADDNRTQRDTLTEMLARRGMKTQSAAGGRAAIEALESAVKNGRLPALVLLDAHMPDMDGFAVAERLRALLRAPGHPAVAAPAIVMLTVPGMPDSEVRRTALSIAAAVNKPVRESALFDAIEEALEAARGARVTPRSARRIAAEASAAAARRPLRILLIEDNAVNQLVTTRLLEREGHSVVGAESGLRGLEAFARESFDAVLMDVQMPGMDGIETTRAIRARERGPAKAGRRTPIIAFTAHAMKEDRERCLAAGMDAYLAKPVDTAELLETLARVTAPLGEKGSVQPVTGEVRVPAASAEASEEPHVAALRRIVGGDKKLLREVVSVFLEDSPAKLTALTVALDARDSNALAIAAHGLKGSAAAIGARAATDAAAHLETLARARNLTEAEVAAAQVREEISRVCDALSAWLALQPH
jgi:PAS domain S-box-containing protein